MSEKYSKLYQTDNSDITIINYFLLLDEITNKVKVRKLIAEPWIQLYEKKVDDGYNTITSTTKTVQDF
ncbi:hypothetical protein NOM01_16885 [Sporolactobacillus sp. STSJ-5]|uniref:hypothetical protein n=1 Tax=Sporolactobacillus sp. STSJ-5 TaxID=2965076 RepID=UPI0021057748|nr:hypothetical protein [Sporolactobacillus sp. STSJ-5]MCQ2011659.1 hypothetical protein [Sporolactobacillus sp. STSJ-5]